MSSGKREPFGDSNSSAGPPPGSFMVRSAISAISSFGSHSRRMRTSSPACSNFSTKARSDGYMSSLPLAELAGDHRQRLFVQPVGEAVERRQRRRGFTLGIGAGAPRRAGLDDRVGHFQRHRMAVVFVDAGLEPRT